MEKMAEVVIVSACLVGLCTRYDGRSALREGLMEEIGGIPIPLCPEQMGGLPTPRPCAEIEDGDGRDVIEHRARVVDREGRDVTENLLRGAEAVVKVARFLGVRRAFMKEKSPSCGVTRICRNNSEVPGSGVTTAVLRKEGIEVRGLD